ncbi:hypothetical protein RND81_01G048200 [Saponaria officinalis]|uniref:Auxin-responsive protein n=1 Tax=Saponaria officinalis TaxID=3572 RepID=A0AAW1N8V4_SAPOF
MIGLEASIRFANLTTFQTKFKPNIEPDRNCEQSWDSKQTTSNEQETKMGSSREYSVRIQQVHKQGNALGRSVDLSKFNDYDQFIDELDRLFDFNGGCLHG